MVWQTGGRNRPTASQPRATHKPPTSHLQATYRLPTSSTQATPRLRGGRLKAAFRDSSPAQLGKGMRGEIRNPKAEGRRKPECRNPKKPSRNAETRLSGAPRLAACDALGQPTPAGPSKPVVSGLGIRASFGLRTSGLRISRPGARLLPRQPPWRLTWPRRFVTFQTPARQVPCRRLWHPKQKRRRSGRLISSIGN